MKLKKFFVIYHSVFERQTLVVINQTDAATAKWIEKNTIVDVDDDVMEAIKCTGVARTAVCDVFSIMRFKEWNGTNSDIATLAHEAFHLAEFVYAQIGVKYDPDISGEAYAYFIGHTVWQVLDELMGE